MPDYSKVVSSPNEYVRYYYNRVDLNDDGQSELVVYFVGSYTCGSGGCTTLIFTPTGQDYRLVSKLTVVNAPILVTPQKTAGWKDLVILVSGGGATRSILARGSMVGAILAIPLCSQRYPRRPHSRSGFGS
jgi:hypothetical protein